MMRHGNKVDIHQPFAEPGHVLTARQDHYIGFVIHGIGTGSFQHFGEAYLSLPLLLLCAIAVRIMKALSPAQPANYPKTFQKTYNKRDN